MTGAVRASEPLSFPRDGKSALQAPMGLEVTPQMIEAGLKVLWESGVIPWGEEGHRAEASVLPEIFRAMIEASKLRH